jgi:Protein of unknown function (DUF3592)
MRREQADAFSAKTSGGGIFLNHLTFEPDEQKKRKMKNGMGTLVFGLFISIFYIVGFGMLGFAGRSIYKSKQAEAWPTAEGKITSCNLKENFDSDGNSYQVDVRYTYWAGGQTHEGKKIAFGYSGSSSRQMHKEIAERLQSARVVKVRYNPSKPSEAVLACGINRSTLFTLVFGLTWTLFTLGFTFLFVFCNGSDHQILKSLLTSP